MDANLRSHCRYWVVYLLVVAVSAASLISTGAKPLSLRQDRLIDLSASQTGSLAELSKNKDWMSQVKLFNKGWLGPESVDWDNPPASQAVSAEVRALQQQPANERLGLLQITGPDEAIPSGVYQLRVSWSALSRQLPVPVNANAGLFTAHGPAEFKLTVSGFFGTSDATSPATVDLGSLSFDHPASLVLPVDADTEAKIHQEQLHFLVQLTDPAKAAAEYGFDTASGSSEIAARTVTGKLSFDDGNATHDEMMTPAGRYTTLIISGDGDLRNYVRCIRSDSGKQVGAYADHFPLMAVAVNNWASIKVHVSMRRLHQTLQYRILSLSADQVTTKELLLWYIVHDLTTKEAEGRILSLSELDGRAAWLENALGVRFSAEEAARAQDPDVQRLLNHLWRLQ